MIVDIEKREPESGWFDLEGGGRIHVRLLSGDDLKAIRKASTTKRAEYPILPIDPEDPKKGTFRQRFEFEEFDTDAFDLEANDRAIIGWEGIFDRNEKPVPITRENKTLLVQIVPAFAAAVKDARKILQERDAARREAIPKNS